MIKNKVDNIIKREGTEYNEPAARNIPVLNAQRRPDTHPIKDENFNFLTLFIKTSV